MMNNQQTLWQEGALLINDKGYHYWVKVYDTGSQYGSTEDASANS